MSDCVCCGLPIAAGRLCDGCRGCEPCAAGDPQRCNYGETCDPASTWHCFTGYCDGSGCHHPTECEQPQARNEEVSIYVTVLPIPESGILLSLTAEEIQYLIMATLHSDSYRSWLARQTLLYAIRRELRTNPSAGRADWTRWMPEQVLHEFERIEQRR